MCSSDLAGLSTEETARARIVSLKDWGCRFGPFSEQDFNASDASPWSLLVQNVEQFHPDTAALLSGFNFAPRWMMDDIMASFSTQGGTIGAHIDSYHVFLVQGQGKRRWTIGREPVRDEAYRDGLDLKILKDPIDGDTVEVTAGDTLYIPPHFAHEGTTIDDALTFSVGFLGPKLSELYSAYGQYLADYEALDHRYTGEALQPDSAGFMVADNAVEALRDQLIQPLSTPAFSQWLATFFTGSSSDEFAQYTEREDTLSRAAFTKTLQAGTPLIKPPYVKFALTPSPKGGYTLGFDREAFTIDDEALTVVQSLMSETPVSAAASPALLEQLDLLCTLYNHQALEFTD